MLTLSALLDRTVRRFPNRPALHAGGETLTWRDYDLRVARTATALKDAGVRPGRRFATLGRNSASQALLFQAGYRLGATVVPVNFRLAAPEIAYILKDSEADLLLYEGVFQELLDQPPVAAWRAAGGRMQSWSSFETGVGGAAPSPIAELAEDAPAFLLYTGGTTGRAKGVVLSHRNVATNALQLAEAKREGPDHCYLHMAPMFHAAELYSNFFLAAGAASRYLEQADPKILVDMLDAGQFSATMLPPVMLIKMLQIIEAEPKKHAIGNLRYLLYGSAPTPEKWVRRALEVFAHARIWHGYGLTETSPILTAILHDRAWLAPDHPRAERLNSVGTPLIGTEVRIVDDSGHELAAGGVGEILVRGPQVSSGYFSLPKETAAAFRNGWFHTGDVGRVDDEGFLTLLDRKKDMVITGGENVYTTEVETVLAQHPDIQDVAVIGVPDELFGEALVAVLVAKPDGRPTTEAVLAHCRTRIGGYKIPRRVEWLDELPRSAVGKIRKDELRRVFKGERKG
jgi:long-chain acyl-CoA synthetase